MYIISQKGWILEQVWSTLITLLRQKIFMTQSKQSHSFKTQRISSYYLVSKVGQDVRTECSSLHPCDVNQGQCSVTADCKRNLICGQCQELDPTFASQCCIEPGNYYQYTTIFEMFECFSMTHLYCKTVSTLWHFRLWSFQGRDTKLERFLAKNQLYSNEITKF